MSDYIVNHVGKGEFENDITLTSVKIPDSVISVDENAFKNCSELSSVVYGSDTNIQGRPVVVSNRDLNSRLTVGRSAFENCSKLSPLLIHNRTESIGSRAFVGVGLSADSFGIQEVGSTYTDGLKKYRLDTDNCAVYKRDVRTVSVVTKQLDDGSVTTSSPGVVEQDGQTYTLTIDLGADSAGIDSAANVKVIKCYEGTYTAVNNASVDKDASTGTYKVAFNLSAGSDGTYNAFYNVEYLASSNLELIWCGSHNDTIELDANCTSIGEYAFESNHFIKTLFIPYGVRSIGKNAFKNCTELRYINLCGNIESVDSETAEDSIFYGCREDCVVYVSADSLSSAPEEWGKYWNHVSKDGIITVAYGWSYDLYRSYRVADGNTHYSSGTYTIDDAEIKPYALYGIKDIFPNIESIYITNRVVDVGEGALSNILGVGITGSSDTYKAYDVGSGNEVLCKFKLRKTDGGVIIGSKPIEVISACGDGWTSTGNVSVVIPSSVTKVDDFAFADCTALKTVDCGINVTYLGKGAFSHCTSLVDVILPKASVLRTLTFDSCTSLKEVEINKYVQTIQSKTFLNCTGLSQMYIPDTVAYMEGPTYDSGIFHGCLDSIFLCLEGDGESTVDTYAFTVFGADNGSCHIPANFNMSRAEYEYWKSLRTLTSSDFNPEDGSLEIKSYITSNGEEIELYAVPNNLMYDFSIIDEDMKHGNTSLVSLKFEDGSNIRYIGSKAFHYCRGLETVNLKNTVMSIEENAFSECESLKTVDLPLCCVGNRAFFCCGTANGTGSKSVACVVPTSLLSPEEGIPIPGISRWHEGWDYYDESGLKVTGGDVPVTTDSTALQVIFHESDYADVNSCIGVEAFSGSHICRIEVPVELDYIFASKSEFPFGWCYYYG